MNITWYGQGCFKIEAKSDREEVVILTYPFDPKNSGLKLPRTLSADIVLQNGETLAYPVEGREGRPPLVVGGPGEYEVKGVAIYAIPVALSGGVPNLFFWIEAEHISLVHVGPLNEVPSEAALQEIEDLDVLFLPVGGQEALNAKDATRLIAELEPRVAVPMWYKIPGSLVKGDGVEPFLKAIGAKPEPRLKWKLARKDLPADELEVVVFEKSYS